MNFRKLTAASFIVGALVVASAAASSAGVQQDGSHGPFEAFETLEEADFAVTGTVTDIGDATLNTKTGTFSVEGMSSADAHNYFAELIPLQKVTLAVEEFHGSRSPTGAVYSRSSSVEFSLLGGTTQVTFTPADAALIGLRLQPDDANAGPSVTTPKAALPTESFTWQLSVSDEIPLEIGTRITVFLRMDPTIRADRSGADLMPAGSANGFGVFAHRDGEEAVHLITHEKTELAELYERAKLGS